MKIIINDEEYYFFGNSKVVRSKKNDHEILNIAELSFKPKLAKIERRWTNPVVILPEDMDPIGKGSYLEFEVCLWTDTNKNMSVLFTCQ